MGYINRLINFIDNSPVSFFVIKNIVDTLTKENYIELKENEIFDLKKGKKYFVKRNDSAIIAFDIGKDLKDDFKFNIVASHSDSPCFKLKPVFDYKTGTYKKVSVEPYGGMICSSWFDRPLSIAGRIFINENGKTICKLVDLKQTMMIPNVCIHFNRNINNGYSYDMAIDMQPFLSEDENCTLTNIICEKLYIKAEDIINFDLYLYNEQKGFVWGTNKEYISSPRLDDLECVYCSLQALVEADNSNNINIYYVADNEEVGSNTIQGAAGDFLLKTLHRIKRSLKISEEAFDIAVCNSLFISADNAHAVHPNHLEYTDSLNAVYMNKGVVIKFNASQSYTSDGKSSSIFQNICKKISAPYQFFANKSNIRGGSTLGNIAMSQLSFTAVDIGLAQLAMHSSFETAGSNDVLVLIDVLREFYNN